MAAPGAALASGSESWTGAGDGSSWTDASNWSGGEPQSGDSVTIAPTMSQISPHVINVPGGTSLQDLTMTNASLSGGAVTVSGDFTWSVSQGQNVLDAPLTVEGSASISGAGKKITMSQITFNGNTDVSGAGLLETEFSGAAITNGGRFQIEPGSSVEANACCANPNKFVSTGILAVPGSAGGTATLGFMGLSIGGAVVVGAGSTLDVIAGPATFSPGIAVDNGGTLAFDQGETVKLAAGVTIDHDTTVQLTGNADFTGTGGFAGTGTFLWTGGHVDGNLNTGPAVTTTISGTGTKDLSSLNGKPITLTLGGTTNVSGTGPVHLGSAATLDNTGKLTANPGTTFEAGTCCASPDHLTNDGTLTVAAAGTQPVTFAYLAFVNHGTVKLSSGKLVVGELSYTQTSGVTSLQGGSLSSTLPVLIKGGSLTGSGTVAAAVVNGGTVKPSTTGGVLTVGGSYQQTGSGTFETVLAGTSPGHKFGQLVVTGAARLAGTIKVTTSHFTPKKKQTFQVMRYHSHSGSFTHKSGSPSYSLSYTGSVHVKY
jgi:fibronectin-binding autotransporter adhesin